MKAENVGAAASLSSQDYEWSKVGTKNIHWLYLSPSSVFTGWPESSSYVLSVEMEARTNLFSNTSLSTIAKYELLIENFRTRGPLANIY